jgi:hypothetical protein
MPQRLGDSNYEKTNLLPQKIILSIFMPLLAIWRRFVKQAGFTINLSISWIPLWLVYGIVFGGLYRRGEYHIPTKMKRKYKRSGPGYELSPSRCLKCLRTKY